LRNNDAAISLVIIVAKPSRSAVVRLPDCGMPQYPSTRRRKSRLAAGRHGPARAVNSGGQEMKLVAGAAAIATTIAAGGAKADCAQHSTFGVWSAYVVGVNLSPSTTPFWLRCTLTFDSDGKLVSAFSGCVDPNNQSHGVAGHLTLFSAPMCAFSGVVAVDGVNDTIDQATITKSKDAAAGVGTFSSGGFAFNMIKVH
jgi:hypothetical protein